MSEEGIATVTDMMPALSDDFVAYENMKAYLIDEDADLQETNQDLELIGVQNWHVQKRTGTRYYESFCQTGLTFCLPCSARCARLIRPGSASFY